MKADAARTADRFKAEAERFKKAFDDERKRSQQLEEALRKARSESESMDTLLEKERNMSASVKAELDSNKKALETAQDDAKTEIERVKADAASKIINCYRTSKFLADRNAKIWIKAQEKELAQVHEVFKTHYNEECEKLEKEREQFEKERELFEKEKKGHEESASRKDDKDEEPPAADPDNEMADEDEEHPAAESDTEMADEDDDEKMDKSEDKVCLSCVPLS